LAPAYRGEIGTGLKDDCNEDELEQPETARTQWRSVADQFREKMPKLVACMDAAEHDLMAFMTLPRTH
jgi:transposase-like protein